MAEAYAERIKKDCGASPDTCPWNASSNPLVQDVLSARSMAKAGVILDFISSRLQTAMGVYESAVNGATASRLDDERAKREAERSAR